jgi:hypothetical protein
VRAWLFFLIAVCSYAPVSAQIQIKKLKEGFIIDKYGKKYTGFLAMVRDEYHPMGEQSQILVYRETLKSKKEKLTVNDVKACQIEQDSFLVLKKFRLPAEDIVHNKFAKVILRNKTDLLCTFEELKLVTGIYSPDHSYITKMIVHYIVFRNDIIMEITDYNFASQMPGVVQGYQALADEIKSGKLTFRDMESIASRYEEWRKSETTK